MNIWLSSDSHYGHKNIAGSSVSSWKSGYRDFKDTAHMNDTIVNTWNKYMKQDDVLYFLGDWSFAEIQNIYNFRKRLTVGTIHFILGNHDEHIRKNKEIETSEGIVKAQSLFNSVQDVCVESFFGNTYTFFMSHYRHLVWPNSHKGVYHLYGHSHGNIEHIEGGKCMDVGIDNAYCLYGEYRPFRISEVIQRLNKKQIKILDHHENR